MVKRNGKEMRGYYDGDSEYFHHSEERKHPDIWGAGGGLQANKGVLKEGGVLKVWLHRITDETEGEIIQ